MPRFKRLTPSRKGKHAERRLLLALTLLTIAVSIMLFLSGCATPPSTTTIQRVSATAASLKVNVPQTARVPCQGEPLSTVENADRQALAAGFVAQTYRLGECETKRGLSVEAADIHNRKVDELVNELRPLTGMEKVFGRRELTAPQ